MSITFLVIAFKTLIEGIQYNITEYKQSPEYQKTLNIVTTAATKYTSGRSTMETQVATVLDTQNAFCNFQVLSCRFSGYLGPFKNGFFDIQNATTAALQMGCRCFVLEIDYSDDCKTFFPQLMIRDVNGNSQAVKASLHQSCDSLPVDTTTATIPTKSTIYDVSTVLAANSFSWAMPNSTDPIVIVLYFLRVPPITNGDKTNLLNYFKGVATGLTPLIPFSIDNIGPGGTYARQAQELVLLQNNILDYKNHVIFFSNADTSAFRSVSSTIPTNEDLDYIVNIRMCYSQTGLGATSSEAANPNLTRGARLETVESYRSIPQGNIASTAAATTLTWTMNMSADPSVAVTQSNADSLFKNIGVQSIPIQIWSPDYSYMFTDSTFKKYSYIAKPTGLLYTRPAPTQAIPQSPAANARGGSLTSPSLSQ